MELIINGESKEFLGITTVGELVASLKLDGRKVAVEKNLEIIPRSSYTATPLTAGDKVEIITFIGGG